MKKEEQKSIRTRTLLLFVGDFHLKMGPSSLPFPPQACSEPGSLAPGGSGRTEGTDRAACRKHAVRGQGLSGRSSTTQLGNARTSVV